MPIPFDFYAAKAVIERATSKYPIDRNPDARLSAAQRKKRHGNNFIASERLYNYKIGNFTVEVSTGVFMGDRLIGVTAFRHGGEREGDDELSKCVHSMEELASALAELEKISCNEN